MPKAAWCWSSAPGWASLSSSRVSRTCCHAFLVVTFSRSSKKLTWRQGGVSKFLEPKFHHKREPLRSNTAWRSRKATLQTTEQALVWIRSRRLPRNEWRTTYVPPGIWTDVGLFRIPQRRVSQVQNLRFNILNSNVLFRKEGKDQ